MKTILEEIKNCKACEKHLSSGVNPVIAASAKSKIIIIGQAPGRKVHATGIPWNDMSGDNLRTWLAVDKDTFYNPDIFALMPMGFCFPGTGKGGDLPPRKECAPLWHGKLTDSIVNAELTLLVGQYAQNYYLRGIAKSTLTDTVRNYNSYLPGYFPLPHPSPRNNIWQSKNDWFRSEVLPFLKMEIHNLIR